MVAPGFLFTQTALRTYRECPYRFRLRYLEEIPWPAVPAGQGAEQAVELGRRFHELARQHYLGLDPSDQAHSAGEPLLSWWQALQRRPPDLAHCTRCYPEAALSVPMGTFRLSARYDLLALGEDEARIVDWKTGDLPTEATLAEDLQTRVYLYVLAEGGAAYHEGRPFLPERLSLIYWHPQASVRIDYDTRRHTENWAFLEGLIAEIARCPAETMLPTEDLRACAHCGYASLCGRPGEGVLEWEEEEGEALLAWPVEDVPA
ncbi:MAG: PD-(D/E)XK nuclease family protein [Chloroflexia bacterium]